MRDTRQPWRWWPTAGLVGLVVCLAGAALPGDADGQATLRLATEPRQGQLTAPLSGTKLTLTVAGSPNLVVEVDEPLVRSKSWKVRPLGPARHLEKPSRWERQYHLEPVGKPGDTLELEVALRFHEPKQPMQKAHWKLPVRITTQIRSISPQEIRPVTGPEPVPPAWSWWPTLVWIEMALILGVLGMIVAELVRRRLRRSALLMPDAWALRELDRLTAMDVSQSAAVERFATLLSDVVRRYLELRFRMQASRQTTAEFLAMMQKDPELGPSQQALLSEFLERCDLAKFARATLSVQECGELSQRAREFVAQTSAPPTAPH